MNVQKLYKMKTKKSLLIVKNMVFRDIMHHMM